MVVVLVEVQQDLVLELGRQPVVVVDVAEADVDVGPEGVGHDRRRRAQAQGIAQRREAQARDGEDEDRARDVELAVVVVVDEAHAGVRVANRRLRLFRDELSVVVVGRVVLEEGRVVFDLALVARRARLQDDEHAVRQRLADDDREAVGEHAPRGPAREV